VIDVDGYIGDSTKNEIEYAKAGGKIIKYLSNFPDLKFMCDSVLIKGEWRLNENEVEELAGRAWEKINIEFYNRGGVNPYAFRLGFKIGYSYNHD
jgi:hypothetical protein